MIIKSLLLGALLLHSSVAWTSESRTVAVNLHGVNYTGNEFRYYVVDSSNPETGGGGELIDPYGAGGITCCATLPKKWVPGTMVEVLTIHWTENATDGKRTAIKETHRVEVPQYATGKPGELWVVRELGGKISVVSSDLQPDHRNWPGKIKGWPIPSIEYRRERCEIFRKHEAEGVKSLTKLLEDLEKNPGATAIDMWKTGKEYDPKSVAGLSGPNDPRYLNSLKITIKRTLDETRQRLQQVMKARP
jgi:hypothetical protein